MKFSHSKLNCLMNNPMDYFLRYIEGIQKKDKAPALQIGSAVHWGIEHNTEDLTEYFQENGNKEQRETYSKEQIQAEAMVHGYMNHRQEIFEKILARSDGSEIHLIEECHEVPVTGKLPSKVALGGYHEFVGIIDLLLLTDEGWIVEDYKTSSMVPNWDDYLDQLYRYIFLLRCEFPDIPVYKIGIINLRKTMIRQKKNENESQFLNRFKQEYEINDEELINYHEFMREDIEDNKMDYYIENLTKMCDCAQIIADNKMFFINFANANGKFKSEFIDIYNKTPGSEILYQISDGPLDENGKPSIFRDCTDIDMLVCDKKNIMNKYSIFKEEWNHYKPKTLQEFENIEKDHFVMNEELLQKYYDWYMNRDQK